MPFIVLGWILWGIAFLTGLPILIVAIMKPSVLEFLLTRFPGSCITGVIAMIVGFIVLLLMTRGEIRYRREEKLFLSKNPSSIGN